jgi:hypothetical protein
MVIKGIELNAIVWLSAEKWERWTRQFTKDQLTDMRNATGQAHGITGSPIFSGGLLYRNMLICEEHPDDVVASVEALLN